MQVHWEQFQKQRMCARYGWGAAAWSRIAAEHVNLHVIRILIHLLRTLPAGIVRNCENFVNLLRSASTSENSKAVFHESLSILVEQGTDAVTVEFRGSMTLPPSQFWDVRRGTIVDRRENV